MRSKDSSSNFKMNFYPKIKQHKMNSIRFTSKSSKKSNRRSKSLRKSLNKTLGLIHRTKL